MWNRGIVISLLLIVATPLSHAQDSRPKIGLALSGGGAKGYAHIGVLKVLEEMRVPVDYVAGTSMGAVVGALYASGMSPEEIEHEVGVIDWDDALTDATAYRELSHRRKEDVARYPATTEFGIKSKRLRTSVGIRTGQKLTFLLARYLLPQLDEPDFSKFPIPFSAVAADLATGQPVVLSRGDIAEAVRASMSIPGVFTPVEMDGRIMVDGGIAANVPVDVVRAMGADIVIAVDIGAPLQDKEQLQSTFAIVDQLSTILTRSNMEPQLAKADLVISPDITGISTFAFEDSETIIPLGVVAAEAQRDALAQYAIGAEAHARTIEHQRVPREREVVVDEIRIVGSGFVDSRFLIDRLETAIGKLLDLEALERDIQWLYGSADFVGIHFGLERVGDGTALVIRVKEKPWGPNYLRAGLTLEASTVQNVEVNLLFNYTRRWINTRGAEWRTDLRLGRDPVFQTEIYQPRSFDRPGFVRAGFRATEEELDIYSGNKTVAVYELSRAGIYADAGLVFPALGEASVGLLYRWTEAGVVVGSPILPDFRNHEGALTANLVIDSRDNPFIPLEGSLVDLDVVAPLEAFNAADDYAWVTLEARSHFTKRKHTAWLGLKAADAFVGEPSTDFASLGGFQNLSGFAPDQLIGRGAALFQLGYLYEAKALFSVLGKGVYLGALVEAGNTGDSIDAALEDLKVSAAAYMALNTNFGPVYVGAAKAETASWQYYITIGQSF
jgi:NTE family protein